MTGLFSYGFDLEEIRGMVGFREPEQCYLFLSKVLFISH